jgi:hypothetical protein
MTNLTCTVDDCTSTATRRGWCPKHYSRWRRTGTTDQRRPWTRNTTCIADNCIQRAISQGYCSKHSTRITRHGSPDIVLKPHTRGGPGAEGYSTVHWRLSHERGRAAVHPCVDCGSHADDWSYDHADPDELLSNDPRPLPYSLKLEHYEPRCRPCHLRYDHTGQR